jgi:hypothetical protein
VAHLLRDCVQCNETVRWHYPSGSWQTALGSRTCPGYARGHKPDKSKPVTFLGKTTMEETNRA